MKPATELLQVAAVREVHCVEDSVVVEDLGTVEVEHHLQALLLLELLERSCTLGISLSKPDGRISKTCSALQETLCGLTLTLALMDDRKGAVL